MHMILERSVPGPFGLLEQHQRPRVDDARLRLRRMSGAYKPTSFVAVASSLRKSQGLANFTEAQRVGGEGKVERFRFEGFEGFKVYVVGAATVIVSCIPCELSWGGWGIDLHCLLLR